MTNRNDPNQATLIGYAPILIPQIRSRRSRSQMIELELEPAVIVSGELDDSKSPVNVREPSRRFSAETREESVYPPAPAQLPWRGIAVASSVVVAAAAVAAIFLWRGDVRGRSGAKAAVAAPAPAVASTTAPAAAAVAAAPAAGAVSPAAAVAAAPAAGAVSPAAAVATAPAAGAVSPAAAARPAPATESAAVATADAASCSLRITADAAGSVVMIDGKAYSDAPLELGGLRCGRRVRVTIANPQRAPWERTVVPEEGTVVHVDASLQRLSTAVAITSVPAGAMVRINGREITTTPAAIPLAADVRTEIELSLPGYGTFTRTIVPRAGASATIDATLIRQ